MNLPLIARVLLMSRRLRVREHWTPDQVAAYQADRLHLLRTYAYSRSPFYRRFHAGAETRPLDELPVLTKAMLMNEFDNLVTDPAVRLASVHAHLEQITDDELFLGKYRATRTSGSTGSPGVFLSNPLEWASVIASYSRAQEWAGIITSPTRRTRLAVVSSRVPWHQSARVGASINSPFFPVRRFDSTEPLETIVSGLNAWQPENLIAYASMANILAIEQLAGRLRISPRAVMSASEVLTPEARSRIGSAWHVPLFDVYAATETAGIASECSSHRLHLFEDLVIAEVVDETNRPVPAGEIGAKLLVTVLFSRTQPLIRYEMSDRVKLSRERCGCGLPFAVIGGIEGRAEDVLQLSGRNGGYVSVQPNVFHGLLDPVPAAAWQVRKDGERIRVLIARPDAGLNLESLSSSIVRKLGAQGVLSPDVSVECVETLVKSSSGKTPLIR